MPVLGTSQGQTLVFPTLSAQLRPFVSDYKMNVFNIAWLDDKTISMFKSDFKFVAKFFQSKRKNEDYVPSSEEIRHVDSLLKMFTALTGDNSFEAVYNKDNFNNKKGGVTMCDIVQSFVNKGRAEGKAEGMQTGMAKGLAEGKAEIIRKMLDAKALTVEQIADILKLPVSEIKKIAQKVPVLN